MKFIKLSEHVFVTHERLQAATSTIDPADRNSFVRMLGNDFFFNCSEADVKKVLSQISRRGGSILQRFVQSQSEKSEAVPDGTASV